MTALLFELAPPFAALAGMLIASLLLAAALARLESRLHGAAAVAVFLALGAFAQDVFDRAADRGLDMLSRAASEALGLLTAAVAGAAIAALRGRPAMARRAGLTLAGGAIAAFGLNYLDELEPRLLVNATPALEILLSAGLSVARLFAASLTVAAAIWLVARKDGSASSQ